MNKVLLPGLVGLIILIFAACGSSDPTRAPEAAPAHGRSAHGRSAHGRSAHGRSAHGRSAHGRSDCCCGQRRARHHR